MFTGSGMPQRFADLDGSMIDVYQAATQMTDESGQTFPSKIDALLDKALGSQGYYGVFTANMHTDSSSHSGANAIIASALSRGRPGRLRPADAAVARRPQRVLLRDRSPGTRNKLSFNIDTGAGANGLRAMVPTTLLGRPANRRDPKRRRRWRPRTQTIKGVEYAFIDAAAGSYEATYAVDETPPPISARAHSVQGNGTADITWDTNEASDSLVRYGTNPNDLSQSESNPGLTTSHSIQLSGLAPNTTYYYRVSSADAASNSATEPESASASRRASSRPRRASPTPPSPTSAPAPPTPTPTSPRPATAR